MRNVCFLVMDLSCRFWVQIDDEPLGSLLTLATTTFCNTIFDSFLVDDCKSRCSRPQYFTRYTHNDGWWQNGVQSSWPGEIPPQTTFSGLLLRLLKTSTRLQSWKSAALQEGAKEVATTVLLRSVLCVPGLRKRTEELETSLLRYWLQGAAAGVD